METKLPAIPANFIPEAYLDPCPATREQRRREVMQERRLSLTPQQVVFCQNFIKSKFNYREAAEATGISVTTAKRWVETDTPVAKFLAERMYDMHRAMDIQVTDVVNQLWLEATREAKGPGDKTVNHNARVSALQVLANYLGMFDKGSKNARQGVQVTINIDGDVKSITGDAT